MTRWISSKLSWLVIIVGGLLSLLVACEEAHTCNFENGDLVETVLGGHQGMVIRVDDHPMNADCLYTLRMDTEAMQTSRLYEYELRLLSPRPKEFDSY